LAPTQRQVRILELRNYAEKNFNTILQNAVREIEDEGWVPADNESFKVTSINQPCLTRRGMSFRRSWGDFLLILTDRAQAWYYVTEETGKSYARAALQPFEKQLFARKWRYPKSPFLYRH
jgi:hypothetical protein